MAVVGYWVVRGLRMRTRVDWASPGGRSHHGTLHARVVGGGGDSVVLLHGLAASNRYWGAKFDALAEGGRLVVPDLLGFGSSPRPAVDYGPDDHADAVAATLVELGVDAPALVVAHSTGCLVALRLAARYPDLVAGIVGFGPPLYPDADAARARLTSLGLLSRLFALDTPISRRLCAWACCAHPEVAARLAQLFRPDLPVAIARDGVRHSWTSYYGTLHNLVLSGDAATWLADITVPVHLVAGADDGVPDPAFLHDLAGTHPSVSVAVWTDADHDEPLVNPDRCIAEIRSFRSRIHRGATHARAPQRQ